MEEAECFEALKQNLLPSATPIRFGVKYNKGKTAESMTGVGIHDNEEFENALVGLMLFRNNYRLLNNR